MEISQCLEILYYRHDRLRSMQHKCCLTSSVVVRLMGVESTTSEQILGINQSIRCIQSNVSTVTERQSAL